MDREIRQIRRELKDLRVAKLPTRISSSGGGGGGGGSSTWIIVGTFEDLPDVDSASISLTTLAKIQEGTYGGGIAFVYQEPGEDRVWRMLTHWM